MTATVFVRDRRDRDRASARAVYAVLIKDSTSGTVDVTVTNGGDGPIWELDVKLLSDAAPPDHVKPSTEGARTVLPGGKSEWHWTLTTRDAVSGRVKPDADSVTRVARDPRLQFVDAADAGWRKTGAALKRVRRPLRPR